DDLLNCDLPCIAQGTGNGLDGPAPFVLVALIEMIAFVRELIGQARRDVTDPSRFERWLTAAIASLVCTSAHGANRNLRSGLGLVCCTVQLEQKGKVMGEDDYLTVRGFSDESP